MNPDDQDGTIYLKASAPGLLSRIYGMGKCVLLIMVSSPDLNARVSVSQDIVFRLRPVSVDEIPH